MLTYPDLLRLERALRGRKVLSIYVNGENTDPATRSRWRIDLRHSLDDIESWLKDSPHAEREEFAACRDMALEALEAFPEGIGAPGWVGFVTNRGAHHAGTATVAVPTMAAWSDGPCLAPYLRAIKESRPVIVGVADQRKVRLFRYLDRRITLVETVRAILTVEPPMQMGAAPRQGFHPGTRGGTWTDASQREREEATRRLVRTVVERVAILANAEGWIVLGGNAEVAEAVLKALGPGFATRAMHAPSLDAHATVTEVAEGARLAASTLRNAYDRSCITRVIAESERPGGLGVVGAVETMPALEEGRVRELYFTLHYVLNHAADAEAAIRLAFEHGALAEHVSGEAAEQLDRLGGVGAQLRYAAVEGRVPPEAVTAGTG
jgi:hypothetical protein